MKKLSLIMMAGLSVLAFQACNNAAKDNKTADSASTVKDTAAMNTSTSWSTTADYTDAQFATTAAKDGAAEVNAGKLAEGKTTNPRVKSFAEMMVTDHTKAGDELAALAKSKNFTFPNEPDTAAQKKAAMLSSLSGKAFDKAYVAAMVDGHKKAVKLFTDASQNCKDADLKAFAAKTLPTLKMHLDSITALQASIK